MNTLWLLVKDVLLTGTGIAIILHELFATTPNATLLVVGLGLTVPSLEAHGRAVLAGSRSGKPEGGEAGSSSASSPPRSPS